MRRFIPESIQNTAQVDPAITALILSILVGIAVFGGLKSISKSFDSSCSFYGYFLYFRDSYSYSLNIEKIPATLALIFTSAFSPAAAVGGF